MRIYSKKQELLVGEKTMNDELIYTLCIENAKLSPCQKRGFGTVIMLESGNHWVGSNQPIPPAKHLCDPECIRFNIQSGADSLIGSCGHSEEIAIWQTINFGLDVKGAKLYVAGVSKPDNAPLTKNDPHFYCVRCATLMHYAGIAGVHVWVDNKWHYLTTDEAYQTSLNYALKKIELGKNQS
jgi:hypothetical protein